MANAKQCDRCGRFFIVDDTQGGVIPDLVESIVNAFNPTTRGEKFADNVDMAICDLCTDCKQSLAKWFNEGKEDGRGSDGN